MSMIDAFSSYNARRFLSENGTNNIFRDKQTTNK